MALQLWFPLNGNLNNQGLSSATITNSGATIDNNGKIGKCYSFDGTNDYMRLPSYDTTKSVSFWVKFANKNPLIVFMDYKSNLAFGFTSTTVIVSTVTDYKTYNILDDIQTDVWTHVALVKGTNLISLYLNGVSQTPASVTNYWGNSSDYLTIGGRPGQSGRNAYHFTGKLNDFRVYDHCLSPKEVKELSKGMIAHYKLSAVTDENKIYDSSGYGHDATLTGIVAAGTGARYQSNISIPTGVYATVRDYIFDSTALNPEMTISCWAKREYTDNKSKIIYRGVVNLYAYTDFKVRVIWNQATSSSSSGNTWATGYLLPESTWTHIALTYKDGVLTFYANGAYIGTSDRSGTGQFIKGYQSNILLNYYSDGTTDNGFVGELSDLRLYATALSADDIKELYDTSACIYNDGTLAAYEFTEGSILKIGKNGVITSEDYEENYSILSIYEDKMGTNQLIEI